MVGKTKRGHVSAGSLPVRLWKNMRKNWILYLMILPVAVYYAVFAYAPMYGIQLAFKNYRVKEIGRAHV